MINGVSYLCGLYMCCFKTYIMISMPEVHTGRGGPSPLYGESAGYIQVYVYMCIYIYI